MPPAMQVGVLFGIVLDLDGVLPLDGVAGLELDFGLLPFLSRGRQSGGVSSMGIVCRSKY